MAGAKRGGCRRRIASAGETLDVYRHLSGLYVPLMAAWCGGACVVRARERRELEVSVMHDTTTM